MLIIFPIIIAIISFLLGIYTIYKNRELFTESNITKSNDSSKIEYIIKRTEILETKISKDISDIKDLNKSIKKLGVRLNNETNNILKNKLVSLKNEINKLNLNIEELNLYDKKQDSSYRLISQLYLDYLKAYPITSKYQFRAKLKNLFDFCFSLFVILLTFPFLLLIALLIKLEDGGPIFFKQERVGLYGRRIHVLKFRTMVEDVEGLKATILAMDKQESQVFKINGNLRTTKIGKYLRETSLDELPQFINVIKGEMSVVGPRPPIPSEILQYKRWQLRRLSMKPGITCIWQVSGRNNIRYEDALKLDIEYIDNWSMGKDILLILKTVDILIRGSGY